MVPVIHSIWLIPHIHRPAASGEKLKSNACLRGWSNHPWLPSLRGDLGCTVGEELLCAGEPTNPRDLFTIAIVKSHQTVGHVPLKISLFLQHGGTIMWKITGRRRHSKDLVQGGLEISCTLTFEGCSKDTTKVEKFIKKSLATTTQQEETPTDMKRHSEHVSEDEPSRKMTCTWIDQDVDTEAIHNGKSWLTVMWALLLQWQFPHTNYPQPTVLHRKEDPQGPQTSI